MSQDVILLVLLLVVVAIAALAPVVERSQKSIDSNRDESGEVSWSVDEKGNPTMAVGDQRVTVFPRSGYWKFVHSCQVVIDKDEEELKFYSDFYETEEQAKYEAHGLVTDDRLPGRYQPITSGERRRIGYEQDIRGAQAFITETQALLKGKNLKITTLRKPEREIARLLEWFDGWGLKEYQSVGVQAELISLAERQRPILSKLAEEVAARINAEQARRRARNPPVSDSQLSSDLARQVDELTRLFAESEVIDNKERERLFREATSAAKAAIYGNSLSYGRARGRDQDLAWQSESLKAAFECHLKTGGIPPPGAPWRIAILLRKAKDFDREKKFLAAWCKHFPSGSGVTYSKLVKRAKESGAIPA